MAEQIQGTEIINVQVNNELLSKTFDILTIHETMRNVTLAVAAMYPFMIHRKPLSLIKRPFSETLNLIGESTS